MSKEIITLIAEQVQLTHRQPLPIRPLSDARMECRIPDREEEGVMPAGFVKVARVGEIPDRKSKKVLLGDEEVALWRVDGHFYAVSNVCAHQHFSSLHKGILTGCHVTCPLHGWTYDLATGCSTTGNGRVRTYRVVIEGDGVFVEAPDGVREEEV